MNRPWKHVRVAADVLAIPSLVSEEELRYLTWLTGEAFASRGAVVDLGTWLGASTAALADGLRRSGRPGRVQGLDLFAWRRGYMEETAPLDLPEGADFEPHFRRYTAPLAAWIDVRKADLLSTRWEGGEIEILFVDAAKSWELTKAFLAEFGPHLVPGESRVVLQDYRHWYTHWLPLVFESRPDEWEEVESVERGTTVTFRPLRPLTRGGELARPCSEESFAMASARAIFGRRMEREGGRNGAWLALGLYRKALIEDSREEAKALREGRWVEFLAHGFADDLLDLELLTLPALQRGWQRFDEGAYEEASALARECLPGGEGPHRAQDLLACASMHLGRLAEAEDALERLLRAAPGCARALLRRAQLRIAQGRFPEAEPDLLEAVRRGGERAGFLRYALAVVEQLFRAGADPERIPLLYGELAALVPGSPEVRASMATTRSR
ncbi:MAG TPA: class I SAM-dependent methyltransferase [Planctomycetota bacterium]|jgi:tetratricopeptide (TPR) repeat protein|nr:class I SAM-dependent methyltransferase [Planctomycetota bacterium]